jgi:hypothetical protein
MPLCVNKYYYNIAKHCFESALISFITSRDLGYSKDVESLNLLTSRVNTESIVFDTWATASIPHADYVFGFNRHISLGTNGILTIPITSSTSLNYTFPTVSAGLYDVIFFSGYVGGSSQLSFEVRDQGQSILYIASSNNALGANVNSVSGDINTNYGITGALNPIDSKQSLINDYGGAIYLLLPSEITISFQPNTTMNLVLADKVYLIKKKLGEIILPNEDFNLPF